MKRQPKTNYPIRLDAEILRGVKRLSECMGHERQDVTRESINIGLPIMGYPEYYELRLLGVTLDQMLVEIRLALRMMVAKRRKNKNVRTSGSAVSPSS